MNGLTVALIPLTIITFSLLALYPVSRDVSVAADRALGALDAVARRIFGHDAYVITCVIDLGRGRCTAYVDFSRAYAHEIYAAYAAELEPHGPVTGSYTFVIVINGTRNYRIVEKVLHDHVLLVKLFAPTDWSTAYVQVTVIDNGVGEVVMRRSGTVVLRPLPEEPIQLA